MESNSYLDFSPLPYTYHSPRTLCHSSLVSHSCSYCYIHCCYCRLNSNSHCCCIVGVAIVVVIVGVTTGVSIPSIVFCEPFVVDFRNFIFLIAKGGGRGLFCGRNSRNTAIEAIGMVSTLNWCWCWCGNF
ncbi:unnamed protein product [Coffea canephora]|uniref:Uncharacterized protein n=1 Tax=Coffea canephora TaxID=49390 RepID=A0A068V5N4_COFCA|nr:unnamed protein product [Coffea canephora]